MPDITVVIPTIPPRVDFLRRALRSVQAQERIHAAAIAIAYDVNHEGAWTTRNRGAAMAQTEWIAFLDDDDEFLPIHFDRLMSWQRSMDADMVWGWFEVVGGTDPFPHYRGRQYDPACPHIVPITYIVRRSLFMDTKGFQPDEIGAWDNQDQPILDGICAAGGKLFAANDITWRWHHHGANTSGVPTRWE